MAKQSNPKTILADLEAKLAAANERLARTRQAEDDIAYEAEIGDEAARKRLADLRDAELAITADIRTLTAAVAEARRRVDIADADKRDEQERAKAAEALELLEQFAERGAQLDADLARFIDNFKSLERDFIKLAGLGYAPGSWALVRVNLTLAATTRLMEIDLHQKFLAPHERRRFTTVVEGWATNSRNRAKARLAKDKAAQAA